MKNKYEVIRDLRKIKGKDDIYFKVINHKKKVLAVFDYENEADAFLEGLLFNG